MAWAAQSCDLPDHHPLKKQPFLSVGNGLGNEWAIDLEQFYI